MKFGPAIPADCEGAILAHAVYLPDGRLRKGTNLSAADIARLEAAGVRVSPSPAKLGDTLVSLLNS